MHMGVMQYQKNERGCKNTVQHSWTHLLLVLGGNSTANQFNLANMICRLLGHSRPLLDFLTAFSEDALNIKSINNTPFSLTLRHIRWHWGVQNTNYDIEINAICSGFF